MAGALVAQAGEALGKSDRGAQRVLGPILRRVGYGINHLGLDGTKPLVRPRTAGSPRLASGWGALVDFSPIHRKGLK